MDDPLTRLVPWWREAGVSSVVALLVVVGTTHISPGAGERSVDAVAYACGLTAAASLALCRRWPVAATAIVAAALAVYTGRHYPGGPALMPGPLVLVGLGWFAPRRTAWAGAVGVVVAVMVGRRVAGEPFDADQLLVIGWTIAAVLAGQALRARGERVAAEREREAQETERALVVERLRIAQDLHDSVAHAMATINVQSGVAAHLVDRTPSQARESLEAIRAASSDVLDELGTILGVLRDHDTAAPRAPLARLGDVDGLVERARTDGLAVLVEIDGDVESPPGSVSTAAFRVVQEALTNTRRHAGPRATVQVRIATGAGGALAVTVTDDGGERPPPTRPGPHAGAAGHGPTSPGLGLLGMRERVESTGGMLATAPTTDGGFRVTAEWPGDRGAGATQGDPGDPDGAR